MLLEPFEHIVWDWNGTLLDDVELCLEILNELLERHGLSAITLEHSKAHYRFPIRHLYEGAGFDLSVHEFAALSAAFFHEYSARAHTASLKDGAERVLRALASKGKSQSILSAHEHSHLRHCVRHLGIDSIFSEVCGLEADVGRSKVDLGRRWLERSALDPRSIVIVGDTDHDFEVASALGVSCILVADGHQSRAILEATGCPVVDAVATLV